MNLVGGGVRGLGEAAQYLAAAFGLRNQELGVVAYRLVRRLAAKLLWRRWRSWRAAFPARGQRRRPERPGPRDAVREPAPPGSRRAPAPCGPTPWPPVGRSRQSARCRRRWPGLRRAGSCWGSPPRCLALPAAAGKRWPTGRTPQKPGRPGTARGAAAGWRQPGSPGRSGSGRRGSKRRQSGTAARRPAGCPCLAGRQPPGRRPRAARVWLWPSAGSATRRRTRPRSTARMAGRTACPGPRAAAPVRRPAPSSAASRSCARAAGRACRRLPPTRRRARSRRTQCRAAGPRLACWRPRSYRGGAVSPGRWRSVIWPWPDRIARPSSPDEPQSGEDKGNAQ